LKNEWIAGAGLDVYEKEPPDHDNPILKLENVILTPHIAYYTEEAIWRLEMSAVEEAIRILQGQLPKNLINKEAFL
jgi:D-3-phosphoglycerate dehydrogenase